MACSIYLPALENRAFPSPQYWEAWRGCPLGGARSITRSNLENGAGRLKRLANGNGLSWDPLPVNCPRIGDDRMAEPVSRVPWQGLVWSRQIFCRTALRDKPHDRIGGPVFGEIPLVRFGGRGADSTLSSADEAGAR